MTPCGKIRNTPGFSGNPLRRLPPHPAILLPGLVHHARDCMTGGSQRRPDCRDVVEAGTTHFTAELGKAKLDLEALQTSQSAPSGGLGGTGCAALGFHALAQERA